MAKVEADPMIRLGEDWFRQVWIGNDAQRAISREDIISQVNFRFSDLGLTLSRGWQDYDPVIRAGRRVSSYAQIAAWAGSQNNRGADAAQQLLDWAQGHLVHLEDLPSQLQDFAMITHLAEVGRGYRSTLESQLYPLLQDIVSGNRQWSDYGDFRPSLTSSQDQNLEWS
jgi:hypothetical protein